ncbi:MAG: hypothetical protein EHM72_14180 [Calditrichaeota bacterium]|nr:MAG: hypothetical protein EHM72_14180 [Calditrichota bacterium]
MEQTAIGLATTKGIDADLSMTQKEKTLLRALAARVAELAARPIEEEKRKLWTLHNDLVPTRPLIFCDPENGWNEIITQDQMICTNPLLRVWEMHLRKEIFWGEQMLDDKVIEPVFYIPYNYSDSGYGLQEKVIGGQNGGSFIYDSPIKDYDSDLPQLKMPEIVVDDVKTGQIMDFAKELFGRFLQVKLRGIWWWTLGMTWDFIKLRGLETMMLDMVLNPTGVHHLMEFLCKAHLHKLTFLESNGLLSLNTGGTYVGSGGFGWTHELPQQDYNPQKVRTLDMWGFAESQETVGVSPEMYFEFIFPYQKRILEKFGLNCYGCCEPIDGRWTYVKQFPRLRRVSVSPWADLEVMAENLEQKYVYSMKPSPAPLALSEIDQEFIRQSLRTSIRKTKNCITEIIMKDNHTIGKNPANIINWCRIAKEEALSL